MNSYADQVATLGDRLTAAREGADLGVAQLAEELGIRTDTLEGWEVDQAEPTASLMGRIATLTGVSLVWLLTGEGSGPQDTAAGAALRAELTELRRILADASARVERLQEALGNV
ncbi:helix-turn-helix transcriptional regulator [Paracoccus sp. 1_MG-2023]|uniref:helix-turn-helix domain-containing protein n=1 Tax=unclassified Paracoccus (in: a-proteobacteria) TaxID=2688777 RepID=UPI001C08CE75|nr:MULTISPECIES: helix-turn-helix transcriptional regulator [unclassified Paracoccus (in: a-proteobacteria)]MBU2956547.1 helix-turn-helix domain-containing protein [Paracoccus sp. C2R09]MDO6668653.1 helix-turn-helix transcriptional regulator [Paracoccus sp. 1_MG-2023]